MRTSRRSFLKAGAAGAGMLMLPVAAPFVKRAYGQGRRTIVFGSGEPLTGNWDPSSHTILAQVNIEALIFGQLIRCPMRPGNTAEIVYELATAHKVVEPDRHGIHAAPGREVPQRTGIHRERREGDDGVLLAARPAECGRVLSGAGGGRDRRPPYRPRSHRQGRLSGREADLPGGRVPHALCRRRCRSRPAQGAAQRHRAAEVRRAAGQRHDPAQAR